MDAWIESIIIQGGADEGYLMVCVFMVFFISGLCNNAIITVIAKK
tara:strand:+ start:1304 stop:1438 length:135 start_codon:yes stop_codon:yes gene_type:complete